MSRYDEMTLPLIDLTPWYGGDPDRRAEVAAQVDHALQVFGFMMVVGHPFEDGLVDRVRAEALEFFRLPVEAKRRYSVGPGGHGWMPSGVEANAGSDGIDSPPDLKESFGFGPETAPWEGDVAGQEDSPTPNLWPTERPGMREIVSSYAEASARLADDLLEIFATALDLPIDFFTSRCSRSPWQTNLNWYPGREAVGEVAEGQFRIGQHTDFGTLTILDRQPGSGGLQVRRLDGEWIDAPFVPGSLTINTGDLLARWTADRWRSTPHRVLPPPADEPTEELVSLVFFHEADPATVVEMLPSAKVGTSTYEPVTAGDFLRSRIESITVGAAG
ncbi:MAG: 2-oxoglutarate and iron-dependent oxygenase domain-containing protein [Nocardioides sp.]|uniref:isopenicillin N synthase family dioxygenase n=1 Tax=Nocardioides sp. TaxID=35761 RepID=UPI0039E55565